MQLEENIPLAPFTTFHIGGPARYLAHVESVADVQEAQALARELGLPFAVLGGGSNVLFAGERFPGVIARMETRSISIKESSDSTLLTAEAGEAWDDIVACAVEEGLWGIENLSGIPGTLGAAPMQNIGAYGTDLSQTLVSVDALDLVEGEVRTFANAECGFGYRTSVFKKNPGRFVILRATLALSREPRPNLGYRDLAERFGDASNPSIADIRGVVLDIRSKKFPDLAREGTAGSFFLNPVVSESEFLRILALVSGIPSYPQEGGIKLPLAYLLDKGLGLKGEQVGKARLFERQPIVVVAERGALGADVIALAEAVRTKVREAFGIELEEEVRIIY